MSIRTVAALGLLGVAVPASLAAQSRTQVDYMTTIEGVLFQYSTDRSCSCSVVMA